MWCVFLRGIDQRAAPQCQKHCFLPWQLIPVSGVVVRETRQSMQIRSQILVMHMLYVLGDLFCKQICSLIHRQMWWLSQLCLISTDIWFISLDTTFWRHISTMSLCAPEQLFEWITKCKVYILSSLPSLYQKIDCLTKTALKSSESKDRKFQVLPESSVNTTQQKTGCLTFTPAFTDVINWSHHCSNINVLRHATVHFSSAYLDCNTPPIHSVSQTLCGEPWVTIRKSLSPLFAT